MSLERLLICLAILFFVCGIGVQASGYLLSPSPSKQARAEENFGNWPKRVMIPNVGINTTATEGGIVDGNWMLSDTSSLYLPESSKLGDGGSTILYAHNRKSLFASLKDVAIGEWIFVEDTFGNTFTYKIYSKETIKPHQIEKLQSPFENSIVLFTCDGWFDQSRVVVKAHKI